ncbi:MAG: peptide chain release factor N(5)-glutamine methyltransferase [Actinomycetota bacterium]|nr:peptide chain release factor N(5)-glutamine methyltransferase [Actinomycetota bacterium]
MTSPRQLLRAAADRLRAAGVASPEVDAELLLAHCLGMERVRLAALTQLPTPAIAAFEATVARREQREPAQYIIGQAPFRHVAVAVGPGVFIPRPETELLVDAVLARLHASPAPIVIDLCSGSGALAVAVADEVPGAQVWAVENSGPALAWLRRNTAGTGIRVVDADVRDGGLLADLAGRADAVLSNPPYVPASTDVSPEVRADPAGAVFAGADGLALVPAVIDRAAALLRRGGMLALEHDDTQGAAVPGLLQSDGRWLDITDHDDLAGRPRYSVAIRG